MKLELGCGQRPMPGYLHNDINPFDGVELVCPAEKVDLDDASLDEVLALGVIEHLCEKDARAVIANTARMLKPGGVFLFDVPDLPVWCRYLIDHTEGLDVPFDIDHVLATLYGWQRWPGDEHRSGWYQQRVADALAEVGFGDVTYGLGPFLARSLVRRRMERPADAHLYVQAIR